MAFKKQLESELDKRYVDMLKGSSKPPFDKETVSSYQSFKNKNTSYHQRIDKEQREFNNALSEVKTRRNHRIEGEDRAEYDRKKSKAHAKYVFAKFLKTIAMLLPVVLAIFVGVDIFSNKALYEVDHSFGWIVTGWVWQENIHPASPPRSELRGQAAILKNLLKHLQSFQTGSKNMSRVWLREPSIYKNCVKIGNRNTIKTT